METAKPKAEIPTDDAVSLREFLLQVIADNDRLYDSRFKASELAVNVALSAQKELTAAAFAAQKESTASAFAASEKAIVKAESAQQDYNSRSNEFRGQLDDQAKTLMPRNESVTLIRALEEKIVQLGLTHEKDMTVMRTEIQALREFRSITSGKEAAVRHDDSRSQWSIGIIVALAIGILDALATLALLLQHAPVK
jgi:phosphopantetheinyl transferase (holo-ACP synthase)